MVFNADFPDFGNFHLLLFYQGSVDYILWLSDRGLNWSITLYSVSVVQSVVVCHTAWKYIITMEASIFISVLFMRLRFLLQHKKYWLLLTNRVYSFAIWFWNKMKDFKLLEHFSLNKVLSRFYFSGQWLSLLSPNWKEKSLLHHIPHWLYVRVFSSQRN